MCEIKKKKKEREGVREGGEMKEGRGKNENETDNLFGINRPGLKNWKKILSHWLAP